MQILADGINSRIDRYISSSGAAVDRQQLLKLAAGAALDAVRVVELYLPNTDVTRHVQQTIAKVEDTCKELSK